MMGIWTGGKSSRISAYDGTSIAEYDFRGMTNGYLPAGTMLYLWDLDTANKGEGPVTITSSVTSQFLDLTWQGDGFLGGRTNVVIPPDVFWNSTKGEFSIIAAGTGDNEADLSIFVTNQNLTSLKFNHTVSSTGGSHAFFMAAPVSLSFSPIPEPTGATLFSAAAIFGILRRKR